MIIAISIFSLMMLFGGPLSTASLIFAQSATTSGSNTSVSSSNRIAAMNNMVLNLGAPLYIAHTRIINTTNVTQNINNATFEGNTTFMLPPPAGRNVSAIGLGYSITNTTGGLLRRSGQIILKTMDGKESATIDFRSFTPINSTVGIGIDYIKTSSTTMDQQQQLASLNNTMGIYKAEAISPTQGITIFWKWSPAIASSTTQALSVSSSISESSGSSINNTGTMMVLNLGTPLFIKHDRTINVTNITQTISNATFEGNGTFMLPPPTGRNVIIIFSGYRVTNTTEGLVRAEGQIFVKTMDGKESATIDFRRFIPVNSTMGVGIAYIRTTSTAGQQQQQLASLNNTLMVYNSEAISPIQHLSIYWKWK